MAMYQICPHCKSLVSDGSSKCPNCAYPLVKLYAASGRWWCNTCRTYVEPLGGSLIKVGTFESINSVISAISGDFNDSYLFSSVGSIKRQISINPDNLTCSKCHSNDLVPFGPIPDKNPRIDYDQGINDAIKNILTRDQIYELISKIETKQVHRIDEVLSERDRVKLGLNFEYRRGYLEGLKTYFARRESPRKENDKKQKFVTKMRL